MSDRAIPEFWEFWTGSAASIERAIADGALDAWIEPISARVNAIDPDLDWEFGPGLRAQHYFCVSAKGTGPSAPRWRTTTRASGSTCASTIRRSPGRTGRCARWPRSSRWTGSSARTRSSAGSGGST